MEICIRIYGEVHCFNIPVLIDNPLRPHGPDPHNYPILDLAATILVLAEEVKGTGSQVDREYLNQITDVTRGFIENIQAGLPEGVTLNERRQG